ncbi:hypothetical protein ABE488_00700 [Luteimonas sp. TWI662]|uniref:hypothetical protein n=1 Tax=Luteimonas sp. TWI662 TaxID=3136789 RepID=UPI00320B26FA
MSGGSNKAANEANRMEQQRQARIASTQARVNQVFNNPSRAADIADYVGAVREFHTDDLNRQKSDADRNLRFALARGGLVGGSTQRDQQQRFGEDYSRGVLDVERRALGAGSELEAADQDARARLIQLATSGLDTTTAAQQAGAALRTNLEAGRSTAMAQGLGDMFGGMKSFADAARTASERRRGLRDSGYSPYQPTAVTGGYYGGR